MEKENKDLYDDLLDEFEPTLIISNEFSKYSIKINENSKKIMFTDSLAQKVQIQKFEEILECNIIEDTLTHGGIFKAIGISLVVVFIFMFILASILGELSIVLSGILGDSVLLLLVMARETNNFVRNISVNIVTSDLKNPLYKIQLLTEKTSKYNDKYIKRKKFAEQIYATMQSIILSNKKF